MNGKRLLDTNIIVAFLTEDQQVQERLDAVPELATAAHRAWKIGSLTAALRSSPPTVADLPQRRGLGEEGEPSARPGTRKATSCSRDTSDD